MQTLQKGRIFVQASEQSFRTKPQNIRVISSLSKPRKFEKPGYEFCRQRSQLFL